MPSFAKFGNDLYTGRRSIDFVGRRRLWYVIAAVAVGVSLLALAVKGLNPGIEFRGGTEFRVSGTSITSELAGQQAVADAVPGEQGIRVSSLNADSMRIQTDALTGDQIEQARQSLAKAYRVPPNQVSYSLVGPTWGADVTRQAVIGLIVFLILVSAVISFYFRTWKMAVAALVALMHDLLLTVGVYALVGFEVTPASVIGFLTILGYSLYDTVVVFDKVRENTEHVTATTKRTFGEAANLAVNQTLVRSINTSVVALLPVGSILFIGAYLLGAGTLKDIALSLFVGIAAGTYSSIFIATPLLVHLREREPELKAQAARVAKRRAEEAEAPQQVPEEDVAEPVTVAAAGATVREPRATAGQRPQPRRGSGRGGRPGGRKR